MNYIDDSSEIVSLSNRYLHNQRSYIKSSFHTANAIAEVSALTVHFIHERDSRHIEFIRLEPHHLTLSLE